MRLHFDEVLLLLNVIRLAFGVALQEVRIIGAGEGVLLLGGVDSSSPGARAAGHRGASGRAV